MARAALVAVALAFATACRTVVPAVPLDPGDPRPASLLSQWELSATGREALRGRARLKVDGRDGDVRLRASQIVVLERPARLRVEVLGLLNQTVAVVATDGDRFEVFRSGDRSYETGAVDPDLLWREAHLALTPEEAVDLLLGALVFGPALRPAGAVQLGDGRIRMDLVDADRRPLRRVTFDATARLRELEVLETNGATRWVARFDGYAPVAGMPFAHEIALDVTAGVSRVEISLRDVELNPALSPEVFRLRAPAVARSPEGEGG